MTDSLITLNEIMERHGLALNRSVIMRHRPHEASLRKAFPLIVGHRRDLFLAYQASQWISAEKAMTRADNLIAFAGFDAGTAIFAGAYRIGGHRAITAEAFNAMPANRELIEFGMTGMTDDRQNTLLFDLEETDFLAGYVGRLVIRWPGLERSWWRWAERNTFDVIAANEQSRFEPPPPDWKEMTLNWAELKSLPRSWRDRLSQWRGIYLITDIERRAHYVGAAYGADNILGRWSSYAASGHGGNRQLRSSDPQNLRFSVLELTSPDLDREAVLRLEALWKQRLHSRQIGLNDN